jgi:RAD51-like protein 3
VAFYIRKTGLTLAIQGRPELLVIDIITPLLAPLLSAVSSQGHALMTELMRHLQSLAQASGMTVLVSSLVDEFCHPKLKIFSN